MDKKYVAIGVTDNHNYAPFAPIVARYWRDRIEYTPIMCLVGNWETPQGKLVIDELNQAEFATLAFAIPEGEFPGIKSASISQGIRQHVASSTFFDDQDLLIPSDADLIPLKKEFYYQHKDPITLYYANAHEGEENSHVPACHQSMRVGTWRQVMGYKAGDNSISALCQSMKNLGMQEFINARIADPKQWENEWYFMQRYSSRRIFASGLSLHRINREGRPPVDRLDRAYWPATYNANEFTDCHAIRPIWTSTNWPRFRLVIEQTMPDIVNWADKFILAYQKAMGRDK